MQPNPRWLGTIVGLSTEVRVAIRRRMAHEDYDGQVGEPTPIESLTLLLIISRSCSQNLSVKFCSEQRYEQNRISQTEQPVDTVGSMRQSE